VSGSSSSSSWTTGRLALLPDSRLTSSSCMRTLCVVIVTLGGGGVPFNAHLVQMMHHCFTLNLQVLLIDYSTVTAMQWNKAASIMTLS